MSELKSRRWPLLRSGFRLLWLRLVDAAWDALATFATRRAQRAYAKAEALQPTVDALKEAVEKEGKR